MEPGVTTVKIFGADYQLRGGDPDFVREVAAHLDAQMQDISKQTRQVSSLKVAVLAAVNICAELFEARKEGGGIDPQVNQRLMELVEKVDQELAASAEAGSKKVDGGETLRGR